MGELLFNNEELSSAFRFSYYLHPNIGVAYSVTLDAIDRFFVQKRLQERRPGATAQPFKSRLSDNALLQASVYLASLSWEIDQESAAPKKSPYFKPDVNDMIVRYVKHLIWETMERNSIHVAVALGALLYTYRTSEIAQLSPDFFKDENIRRVKSGIINSVIKRFESLKMEGGIYTRNPTPFERQLVSNSLSALAPSVPQHVLSPMPVGSILVDYFGFGSTKSEWERNHALIDPNCAGITRLIQEYNDGLLGELKMRLENPDEKLEVPDFGPGKELDGKDDRFNPPPLNETDLISMKRALERNQRRREKYRPRRIRVRADGSDVKLRWLDNNTCEPFLVSPDASYIEVFGEDSEGELLLAALPLKQLEFEEGEAKEFSIEHSDEFTLALLISPNIQNGSRLVNSFSVELSYEGMTESYQPSSQLFKGVENGTDSIYSEFRKASLASHVGPRYTTPITKFLWFLAGAETSILEQEDCAIDRTKYSAIGLVTLFVAIIATLSTSYAILWVSQSSATAFIGGLLWSCIVLSIDRFLLRNVTRDASSVSRLKRLALATPQLVLLVLLGLIISYPLQLRLFDREIASEIARLNASQMGEVSEAIAAGYPEIDRLKSESERLKDEVALKERQREQAYRMFIAEADGTAGSGIPGKGPLYAEKKRDFERAEGELVDIQRKNGYRIAEINDEIRSLIAVRDERIGAVQKELSTSNGLLTRLSALRTLQHTNPLVGWVGIVLMVLLTLFIILPFSMQLLSRPGPYDFVLEATIKEVKRKYELGLPYVSDKDIDNKLQEVKNLLAFRSRVA